MTDSPLPKVDSPLAPEPYSPGAVASELPYIAPAFHPSQLSSQQEKFIHYYVSGMSVGAASTAVGISRTTGENWLEKPLIKQAVEYFREKSRDRLSFSIEEAHKMYLDTYRLAEAKEDPVAMKNVVDSLVKLHGVAAAPKPQQLEVKVTNAKQAARLTDEKLLEQAGLSVDHLTPQPKRRAPPEEVIDASFTEVPKK